MDIAKKKKASIRSGKKKAGPDYKSKIKMKKAKSDYYDFNLVAVIILIMLYSTSSYMAQINEGDDMFYFKKQAMYSIGCLVLAIIVSYFDYHILAKFPFVIYVAAAFLMVLVKTPLGVTSHVFNDYNRNQSISRSVDTGKNTSGNCFQWCQEMAQNRTDSVSAGRDCKDCSDHHIVLSDRQNGKESGNPESYYGTSGNGRHSGPVCICVYG